MAVLLPIHDLAQFLVQSNQIIIITLFRPLSLTLGLDGPLSHLSHLSQLLWQYFDFEVVRNILLSDNRLSLLYYLLDLCFGRKLWFLSPLLPPKQPAQLHPTLLLLRKLADTLQVRPLISGGHYWASGPSVGLKPGASVYGEIRDEVVDYPNKFGSPVGFGGPRPGICWRHLSCFNYTVVEVGIVKIGCVPIQTTQVLQ